MTLNHLKYVVETARCGSINRAAQTLFVSQSAISPAIQKIEEEFDICLFTRNSRGIITTPEGNEFIRHAESILLQTQQLRNIMNHTTEAPSYRCASPASDSRSRRRRFCGISTASRPMCGISSR